MNLKAFFILFLIGFSTSSFAQKKELVNYVNTLQGTNSKHELTRGNTYPTTALPFGMHTWTPQTGKNGDGWKYQYFKKTLRGFQQAHQCSSWTRDYAVFSFLRTSKSGSFLYIVYHLTLLRCYSPRTTIDAFLQRSIFLSKIFYKQDSDKDYYTSWHQFLLQNSQYLGQNCP